MTSDHNAGQADQRRVLKSIYDAAVAAAVPTKCLPAHFPALPEAGRLIIIATGKAGAAMAAAAEDYYVNDLASGRIIGLATTRKGYAVPLRRLELIEAGHPVPDRESTQAAERALELASEAREGDLVLALISGGASALWAAPVPGVTLEEKQALTRTLLKVGAPISEINCVRKHLSRIKGGRLAKAAFPAKVLTLAISDVPGDTPDGIGSGPTVPDRTTLADARGVLARWGIKPAASIKTALSHAENETLKGTGRSHSVTSSSRQNRRTPWARRPERWRPWATARSCLATRWKAKREKSRPLTLWSLWSTGPAAIVWR
jgi:glycerate 2-kinase